MSDMLFYMGRGPNAVEAIRAALSHCAPVMEQNPSLILELLEINPCGSHWEAHIRVMAMEHKEGADTRGGPDDLELNPKSPEHFRSGRPDDWRPIGMKHNVAPSEGFDVAAHGGYIPDVPLQDLELAKEGWSEVDIRMHASGTDQHPSDHRADELVLNYE